MRSAWIVALTLSPVGALAAEPAAPDVLDANKAKRELQESSRRSRRELGLLDELQELRSRERTTRLEAERAKLADVEGCAPPSSEWDETGFVTLATEPPSRISAGDVELGETPAARIPMPPGCYTLTLTSLVDGTVAEVKLRVRPNRVGRFALRMNDRRVGGGDAPILVASEETLATPRRRHSHR